MGSEVEAESLGLPLEPLEPTLLLLLLLPKEDGFVERLSGRQEVIKDPSQLVGGGSDRLGSPELRPHSPIEGS